MRVTPRVAATLAALLASAIAPGTARAQDESLPAYYEWFMRRGSQQVTAAESERDTRIAGGEFLPATLDLPLPELTLPDVDGTPVALRSIAGKKRLVVVVFRTWW